MREDRGNLAVARPLTDKKTGVGAKRRKKSLLKTLPVGEKLLYLFSVLICAALVLIVISRYAKVTELNVAIRNTEIQIQETEKVNFRLETQKRKLGSVERIRKFAESKGLELNAQKILPSIQP